jgi:hypothetical protein
MLKSIPPTFPMSDLRTRQPELIASLRKTPTLLTHHGRSAGVLVHPRTWNYLVEVYEKAKQAGLLEIDESQLTELETEMA